MLEKSAVNTHFRFEPRMLKTASVANRPSHSSENKYIEIKKAKSIYTVDPDLPILISTQYKCA